LRLSPRVHEAEGRTGEQAELRVRQREVARDRHAQEPDDRAVEDVPHVDHDEQAERVGRIAAPELGRPGSR
jgi:hypothetical protein